MGRRGFATEATGGDGIAASGRRSLTSPHHECAVFRRRRRYSSEAPLTSIRRLLTASYRNNVYRINIKTSAYLVIGHNIKTNHNCNYNYNYNYNYIYNATNTTNSTRKAYWLGLRRVAFTCVGWQVTLCDPKSPVTPRSSVMGLVCLRAIHSFNLFQALQLLTTTNTTTPSTHLYR